MPAIGGAEIVHLRDGSRLNGTVVKQTKAHVTVESSFGRVEIPTSKVARIELESEPSSPAVAVAAATPSPTPATKKSRARLLESLPLPAAQPAPTPECRMGSDGKNVCGYHCLLQSNGRFVCADTPDGKCAFNADGTVTCTRLAADRRLTTDRSGWPEPETRLNSDGSHSTGYNCQLGSNGRFYCASRPDGRCKLNSNGTFTCP